MKYYSFDSLFEQLNKMEGVNSKIDKASERDRLIELMNATGINTGLLKVSIKTDVEAYFSECVDAKLNLKTYSYVRKGSFIFPEASMKFFLDILKKYSEPDFKALRKGNYVDVPIDTRRYLLNNLTEYLECRGYGTDIVNEQMQKMDRRMSCSTNMCHNNFVSTMERLSQFEKSIQNSPNNLHTFDVCELINYMTMCIESTISHFENVRSRVNDSRFEESQENEIDLKPKYDSELAEGLRLQEIKKQFGEQIEGIRQASIIADLLVSVDKDTLYEMLRDERVCLQEKQNQLEKQIEEINQAYEQAELELSDKEKLYHRALNNSVCIQKTKEQLEEQLKKVTQDLSNVESLESADKEMLYKRAYEEASCLQEMQSRLEMQLEEIKQEASIDEIELADKKMLYQGELARNERYKELGKQLSELVDDPKKFVYEKRGKYREIVDEMTSIENEIKSKLQFDDIEIHQTSKKRYRNPQKLLKSVLNEMMYEEEG